MAENGTRTRCQRPKSVHQECQSHGSAFVPYVQQFLRDVAQCYSVQEDSTQLISILPDMSQTLPVNQNFPAELSPLYLLQGGLSDMRPFPGARR
jgi:hypothetical protein